MTVNDPGRAAPRFEPGTTAKRARIDSTSSLVQKFTHKEGLTGDHVSSALEDSEGNVWVATVGGLDRFRRKNVVQGPFPTPTDRRTDPVLMTDQKGIVWEGSEQSLMTVASDGVSVAERSSDRASGSGFGAVRAEMTSGWRDFEGALWIGGRGHADAMDRRPPGEHRISRQKSGGWSLGRPVDHWRSQRRSLGFHSAARRLPPARWRLGSNTAICRGCRRRPPLFCGRTPADRVWFGYLGNQIALRGGRRVRTFSVARWTARRECAGHRRPRRSHLGGRPVWTCALRWQQFHTIAGEADADFRGISGVVETADGDFWLNMATGVARIPAAGIADKLRDPQHKLQYDLFDFRDGVKGIATQIRPLPSAVQAGDGRIWISGSNGVYWIDPARIYKNPIPPPVTIEAIYEGDRRFSAFEASRLPKLPQNVRIEYTALSLSIPERVRFRYQLEGYDKDWQDVGTRRAAYYPKLPPGHFRFHVIACNNDGVWNQTGAVAEIVVPPAFYQTAWFEALCVFAGLALLWGLYRYRLHQIAREFNMRLEERVSERTRLARDLHDTLLQSFQGLMLRLQAIDESLPEGEIKDELEKTLDRGDQVVAESRKAVHDLRLSTVITNDLARASETMGDELSGGGSTTFGLVVEGETRDLHPIVRDEIYRIAREALRNAFSHARAHHIEAEITYGEPLFRLRIRDDGEGIAPACWKRAVWGTTVCRECASGPRRSGRSWISGAEREPGRRSI